MCRCKFRNISFAEFNHWLVMFSAVFCCFRVQFWVTFKSLKNTSHVFEYCECMEYLLIIFALKSGASSKINVNWGALSFIYLFVEFFSCFFAFFPCYICLEIRYHVINFTILNGEYHFKIQQAGVELTCIFHYWDILQPSIVNHEACLSTGKSQVLLALCLCWTLVLTMILHGFMLVSFSFL